MNVFQFVFVLCVLPHCIDKPADSCVMWKLLRTLLLILPLSSSCSSSLSFSIVCLHFINSNLNFFQFARKTRRSGFSLRWNQKKMKTRLTDAPRDIIHIACLIRVVCCESRSVCERSAVSENGIEKIQNRNVSKFCCRTRATDGM